MISQLLFAFLATTGFAFILNLHWDKALLSAVGGTLGWLGFALSLELGMGQSYANFFGAVALSAYGEFMARRTRTPVTAYVTAALIPLVPGGGLYTTMLSTISGDYDQALVSFFSTITASGALAIGILVVFTLNRTYVMLQSLRKE